MKKQKILLIGLIIAFMLLLAGTTYAYIRKTRVQGEDNQLSTLTCLNFDFTNADANNTKISIENAYPIPDAEGLEETPYTFTVTNKCNTPIVVDIGMQTIGTGLNTNYIKYAIDDGTNKPGIFTIGSKPTKTVKVDNTNVTINVLDKVYLDANTAEDQDTSTVEVDNDTPSEGARKTYNVRLWIDEATTWEQAHDTNNNILNYTGKIVLAASPTKGRYIPEFSAEPGTLLAAIKTGDYEFINPLTSPGKEINSYSESLIAKTEDDYGTSYYFRGNIQNNYVVFANKCWRIVRIDGLGNTKLILWNNDNNCTEKSAPANSAFNAKTLTYTKTNGTGLLYQTASGVGFMYGKPDSTTLYTNTDPLTGAQDNKSKSTILDYLKSWYNKEENGVKTFTDDEKAMLADVIWCGDKSRTSGNGYGQYGEANSYFSARARIYAGGTLANAKPTLICPDEGLEESPTISKYTVEATEENKGNGDLDYPIGLITVDEVAFAGGAYNVTNNSYYLAAGSWYWTMSPYYFNGSIADVWSVYDTGYLYNTHVHLTTVGVRPAVSLKPEATIEQGGDGTVNNPYVINGLAS